MDDLTRKEMQKLKRNQRERERWATDPEFRRKNRERCKKYREQKKRESMAWVKLQEGLESLSGQKEGETAMNVDIKDTFTGREGYKKDLSKFPSKVLTPSKDMIVKSGYYGNPKGSGIERKAEVIRRIGTYRRLYPGKDIWVKSGDMFDTLGFTVTEHLSGTRKPPKEFFDITLCRFRGKASGTNRPYVGTMVRLDDALLKLVRNRIWREDRREEVREKLTQIRDEEDNTPAQTQPVKTDEGARDEKPKHTSSSFGETLAKIKQEIGKLTQRAEGYDRYLMAIDERFEHVNKRLDAMFSRIGQEHVTRTDIDNIISRSNAQQEIKLLNETRRQIEQSTKQSVSDDMFVSIIKTRAAERFGYALCVALVLAAIAF